VKPSLSPLTGGALLQELAISSGERHDLGLLLERARPLLGLALLGLRLLER
jgi:hypothetical protein